MNLEEARAWTTSPPVVREMSQMDDEAEAAIDTMDRTLSRMRVYSSATQGEYRRAGNTVNTSQGAFRSQPPAAIWPGPTATLKEPSPCFATMAATSHPPPRK